MKSVNPYVERINLDGAALWQDKAPLLHALDLELTERCNLDCIHCYINQPAESDLRKRQELSTDDIRAVLCEAAALGCLSVRFSGGEPLLREDFCEIYRCARSLGLKVQIFTNATRVTPGLAEILSRIPPLEKIQITIYGAKESAYEAVTRTPGSFKAALEGIHLLRRNGIPFEIKTVVLRSNRHELESFENMARALSGLEGPPGLVIALNLRGRRDSPSKNRSIKCLRMSPEESMQIITRQGGGYLKEMKAFCAAFLAPAGDRLFSCGAGKGGACVDAYGNLQACMLLRQPATVYSLKAGSIRDALEHFFPEMRMLTTSDPLYLQRCSRCFLKSLCEQCPAKSWMEHGVLDRPVEYACEIAHAQAKYLGLLRPDEKAWEIRDWRERVKAFTGHPAWKRPARTTEPQ